MIVFVLSVAALAAIGWVAARRLAASDESRATAATRGLLAAAAAVIAVQAALGGLRVLTATVTLVALAALAVASTALARRRPVPSAGPREAWTPFQVALAFAILAALSLRLWAGLHKTTFLYDALSYHLHVPATWMHDRRIEIVPAVFGDPAPAYAPANLELVFLFLLSPLRSDYLAGVGQLPFAALAVLAIVAAVRESGGGRAPALAAALAFLLIPEIWQQIPTAMVDLGMAAFLLASLPFAFRLLRNGNSSDGLVVAAACGLAAGTKYVGLVLAAPFVILAFIAIARRAPFLSLTAVEAAGVPLLLFATGGFWYVRNLVVTGNPIYPGAVPGLPLPALYDASVMRAWDYHVPVGDLPALGGMLVAAGVGFASAAAIALVMCTTRNWRSPELPLVGGLVAIFWLVIPYQESRFLFASFGVAAMALGRIAGRSDLEPTLGWGLLTVAIVGSLVEFTTLERLVLVPAGVVGAVAQATWKRIPSRARPRPAALVTVGVAALITVVAAGFPDYRARAPGYAMDGESRVGEDGLCPAEPIAGGSGPCEGPDGIDLAWSWVRANVRGVPVAYAGTNLAFPLAGEGLANRVSYVNISGQPTDLLHDFASRPEAAGRHASGAEPAPYRAGADAGAWLANLRAAGARVLFVAALYPIVRRSIDTDADGFPVERTWADARPALFQLRYASPAARVYAISPSP